MELNTTLQEWLFINAGCDYFHEVLLFNFLSHFYFADILFGLIIICLLCHVSLSHFKKKLDIISIVISSQSFTFLPAKSASYLDHFKCSINN